jgi:hypothetical protein
MEETSWSRACGACTRSESEERRATCICVPCCRIVTGQNLVGRHDSRRMHREWDPTAAAKPTPTAPGPVAIFGDSKSTPGGAAPRISLSQPSATVGHYLTSLNRPWRRGLFREIDGNRGPICARLGARSARSAPNFISYVTVQADRADRRSAQPKVGRCSNQPTWANRCSKSSERARSAWLASPL